MIKQTLRKLLKEEVETMYQIGHYPTSDETDSRATSPKHREHGCIIELTDGTIVHCMIIPLAPKICYGAITKTGEKYETFALTCQPSHYFSKFKKKIDGMFDANILDVDKARADFNSYISKVKTGK